MELMLICYLFLWWFLLFSDLVFHIQLAVMVIILWINWALMGGTKTYIVNYIHKGEMKHFKIGW